MHHAGSDFPHFQPNLPAGWWKSTVPHCRGFSDDATFDLACRRGDHQDTFQRTPDLKVCRKGRCMRTCSATTLLMDGDAVGRDRLYFAGCTLWLFDLP